jgi:P27 family predicted phage terminase small subunit
MKRGRKPKPRALRVLEGNAGKRDLPPDIRPQLECDMPSHLEGDAAKEWNRVIGELRRLGLATGLDRACLSAYAQSWARWIEAERALKRYGAIVKAPTGFPMLSPYLHVANIALKQIREFAAEFGMTPSSRARVAVEEFPAPPQPPRDPSGPTTTRRFFTD